MPEIGTNSFLLIEEKQEKKKEDMIIEDNDF